VPSQPTSAPSCPRSGVARLPVPRLADWCAVEVSESGQASHELIAIAHIVPEKETLLKQLAARSSEGDWLPPAAPDGEVRATAITAFAKDAEHEQLLRSVGVASIVRVPLVVRERTLGVMTYGIGSARRLDADRRLMFELAQHAALAVDNARLYLATQLALRARDEFLSIASHELRTPLTALQLQLQSLRRAMSTMEGAWEPARTRIESAARQASRLAGLTERLLDVSRIAAGRLKLDLEEFDLADAVRELTERFADEAAKAGCKLELDLRGPARGLWDRLRVEQIVSNLLSNALKYGRGQPIQVLVDHDPMHATLSVNDAGIGIPEQDIKRIFERFERAVPSRQYGGLGIGLYVARQIVEAHGGEIRVESRVGIGSRFTIALPRQPAPAARREET
jgi:signal transduction histidine kinase